MDVEVYGATATGPTDVHIGTRGTSLKCTDCVPVSKYLFVRHSKPAHQVLCEIAITRAVEDVR